MSHVRNSINLLIVLLFVFSASYCLGKAKGYSVLAELSLTLASVALGIIATTWLIDRIISDNAARERDRMRRTAYENVKTILQSHLYFLQGAYKASTATRPDALPKTTSELLSSEFFEALGKLDFEKDAPVSPSRTWAVHISEEFARFSQSIHKAIDRYVIVLDSPEVKQLERLAESGLISFARLLPTVQAQNRAAGRRLGRVFRGAPSLLSEHIRNFLAVVSLANSHISPLDRIEPDAQLWADNIAPAFGDSVSDREG